MLLFLVNCGYFSSKYIQFNNLPSPDGPFSVGSSVFYWIDESRSEWYLETYKDQRRLMAQIWYPALKTKNLESMFYIERMDERVEYISKELGVSKYLF